MPARLTKGGGARKRPVRYGRCGGDASHDALLASALRAHRKGLLAEAAVAYRTVLDLDPGCVDALANLGAALVSLGHAREAAAVLTRAADTARSDARVQRDAGIGLAAVGQGEAARQLLERAVSLDPRLTGAALHLVRVCADGGDHDGALGHARALVARAPAAAAVHLGLHRVLFRGDQPELAVPPARAAVELDPSWDLARLQLAGALSLSAQPDRAAAVLAELRGSAGQRAAFAYAIARRSEATRFFSTWRDVLAYALESAANAGPVLEFGVRHGISTRLLASLARDQVHAFDSFHGLPEPFYGRAPGAFSTDGELPDVPANVTLHVGLFRETLPRYGELGLAPPRLVHVDSDLYSSARDVLTTLAPILEPGTVLVFDEYLANDNWQDDEYRAFQEVREERGFRYEYLAFNWFTGQAVVRIG